MSAQARPTPGKTLISPSDHTLILIDHQSTATCTSSAAG